MSNELQSLNERIAEKVGESLVDLIPADQWQKLVDSQIQAFIRDKAPNIIQQELTKKLMALVRVEISTGKWTDTWESSTNVMTNEAVNEMLIKSAPEIFSAMLSPIMTGLLQDLRNRLRTY